MSDISKFLKAMENLQQKEIADYLNSIGCTNITLKYLQKNHIVGLTIGKYDLSIHPKYVGISTNLGMAFLAKVEKNETLLTAVTKQGLPRAKKYDENIYLFMDLLRKLLDSRVKNYF